MTDVQTIPSGQVADAAKVLENGDTVPKILDDDKDVVNKDDETKAPPSTPIKPVEDDAGDNKEEAKKSSTSEAYPHFPRFRVTWDSTIPSLMSLKSPGNKKRRGSQSTMAERHSVLTAQEMSPQVTLVEFIATSASYHGVRRQDLTALEDDLFRVFRNNVMPANAAAWYMAKRRFYKNSNNGSRLLPMVLKEYPKKFALKNNVVQFLESYSPNVARMKMKYMVDQGLYAYFSHKADEYGVYIFDPLYYEETEPFHANLRLVTNIYNNQRIKLIPAFFKKYKKQFHYKQLSPTLVAVSKVETEILHGVTGVVVAMFDKKYGLIKFNRNTESCLALFSTNALYHNGYKFNVDPKTLPPVFFDAYKIPDGDRVDKFKWFAVLTWVGRRPNPKFCATKSELTSCHQYKTATVEPVAPAQAALKKPEEVDYMKMGVVMEIRKNGAVAVVKDEGDDNEQKYWIPGWSFTHINTPKLKFLTTTKGVGLRVDDLVNFYTDPNLQAKPFDGVACNVDVFKHADLPKSAAAALNGKRNRKKSTNSTSKGRIGNWREFVMSVPIESDTEDDTKQDPDWVPPDNYEDSDDLDSDISADELEDLTKSMKIDVNELESQMKIDVNVLVSQMKEDEKKIDDADAVIPPPTIPESKEEITVPESKEEITIAALPVEEKA